MCNFLWQIPIYQFVASTADGSGAGGASSGDGSTGDEGGDDGSVVSEDDAGGKPDALI